MKRFFKTLVLAVTALAPCASGAFALEVSAHVNLEGNLANGGTGAATRFIEINEQGQQDPDAAVITVKGEKAGGEISFAWTFEQSDDTSANAAAATADHNAINDISVRKATVWFKPTDWSKITMGTLMQHLYREYLRFWEDASGSKAGSQKWMNYREGSGIDYGESGAGIALTLMPVQGLTIEAAAAPGTSDESDNTTGAFATWNGNHSDGYLPWGAVVKYSFGGWSVGAAFADNGSDKYKLLSVGFDVGHPFGSPYYFFIQPRFYFGDKHSGEIGYGGYTRNNDVDDYALTGIAIDNWFKFSLSEKLLLSARLPFVVRLTGDDDDPSYFLYDIEFDYNKGDYTPYIEINNCNRIYAPLMFGSEDGYTVADSFIMDIRPGVKFRFASVEVTTGVDLYFGPGLEHSAGYTVPNSTVTTFGWQIPFGVNISL